MGPSMLMPENSKNARCALIRLTAEDHFTLPCTLKQIVGLKHYGCDLRDEPSDQVLGVGKDWEHIQGTNKQ